MNNYISSITKVDEQYHRSPIIIHRNWQWHFADLQSMEQLNALAELLGFSYKVREQSKWRNTKEIYTEYEMDREIISPCDGGFWKMSDLPADAKPFKALSNGSIVTCYFTNDGKSIRIYRPNPNAKEVYKPLALEQHIEYQKTHGSY